jgi:DNA mismatch endonuclease (patch repair protein)
MRAIGTRDTAIEKRLAGLLTQAGFAFHVQDASLFNQNDNFSKTVRRQFG